MIRSKTHILESESERALMNLLPVSWIFRKRTPDYGIDMDIEIVEGEKVTNKVLWVQLKATESQKKSKNVSHQMETKHLKYYEICRLPVVILYWIKSKDIFYYLFAQKYIKETLSRENSSLREQKTVMIKFSSVLENADSLNDIAMDGYFYLSENQLNIDPQSKSAHYWMNGIMTSDNAEFKNDAYIGMRLMNDEKYSDAIEAFENILRIYVLSPAEKVSILLSLGNAYYWTSDFKEALKNYEAILKIVVKLSGREELEAKSAVLGNTGVIYRDKGDLESALRYHSEALKIYKEIGYKQGEALALGYIGSIHGDKGDLESALQDLNEALQILTENNLVYGKDIILKAIDYIKSGKANKERSLFKRIFRHRLITE